MHVNQPQSRFRILVSEDDDNDDDDDIDDDIDEVDTGIAMQ